MKKLQKVELVKNLTEELKEAKSLVLVNYSRLNVKAQQDLKSRLKEVGGRMVVVKNTLLKRAGESAKLDKNLMEDSVLQGQTALILASADPLAPIQVLGKFAKEFVSAAGEPSPKFKVGVIDGSFQDEAALTTLSTLPGRDALLGQLLGSLMSGMYGLVGTLSNPMQGLLYTLHNARKSDTPDKPEMSEKVGEV